MTVIKVEDYEQCGLGDIYYGLIQYVSSYVNQNFNPMEIFYVNENETSTYAEAIEIMKDGLKEFLDYLKENIEIYLPSLGRNININYIDLEEQMAIEKLGKEYMIAKLNNYLENKKMSSTLNNQNEEEDRNR